MSFRTRFHALRLIGRGLVMLGISTAGQSSRPESVNLQTAPGTSLSPGINNDFFFDANSLRTLMPNATVIGWFYAFDVILGLTMEFFDIVVTLQPLRRSIVAKSL